MKALGETLSIALLGTPLAAVFALPIGVLAAPSCPFRRFLPLSGSAAPRLDSWCRYADLGVGLDQCGRVRAVRRRAGDCISDFGAFGKLFSETIEAADRKQVEGVRASGGNALHEIRFGLMPQVLPVIAGQMLYFFSPTPSRRPSSGSSVPVALAFNWLSKSACWNGNTSHS